MKQPPEEQNTAPETPGAQDTGFGEAPLAQGDQGSQGAEPEWVEAPQMQANAAPPDPGFGEAPLTQGDQGSQGAEPEWVEAPLGQRDSTPLGTGFDETPLPQSDAELRGAADTPWDAAARAGRLDFSDAKAFVPPGGDATQQDTSFIETPFAQFTPTQADEFAAALSYAPDTGFGAAPRGRDGVPQDSGFIEPPSVQFAPAQADEFTVTAPYPPDTQPEAFAPWAQADSGLQAQAEGFSEPLQPPADVGPQPASLDWTAAPQAWGSGAGSQAYSDAMYVPRDAAAQMEPLPSLYPPDESPDEPQNPAAERIPAETEHGAPAVPPVLPAETPAAPQVPPTEAPAAAEEPPPAVFSLLLCVHDTPPRLLRASVRSVLRQTYPHFELCVADDNSNRGATVRALRRLLALDPRVKVRFLMSGSGTASAENRAAKLATGGYLGFLSPGDLLAPGALSAAAESVRKADPDAIYTDEDRVSDLGLALTDARNKPDFSPETLRSADCVGSLFLVRTKLFFDCGGFEPKLDGAHRYSLALKLTERGARFFHIREVLCHRRGAAALRIDLQARAVRAHLDRTNALYDDVSAGPHGVRVRYRVTETPLFSIIIPNKDHAEDLTSCVGSIRQNTKYRHYEIIVVENNSENPATLDCYDALKRHGVRIISYAGSFNYAAINNFAAKKSRGKHLVFLNNDVEIFTPDWLTELLMFAQQPDVGAVGTKLLYPDGTIQHAGGRFGGETGIEHLFAGEGADTAAGYGRAQIVCDVSFVTGALMMTRRESFFEVGGMDEALASSLADADYCLRQQKAGRRTVYTPYAAARHYESKSVGKELTAEQRETQRTEAEHLRSTWGDALTERYSRF